MTQDDYINMVVGKPWKNRAEGPCEFDCMGLVIDSYRKLDDIEIPQIPGYADINCSTAKAAIDEMATGKWSKSQPANGAIMVAYMGGEPDHVGRVLCGGILHAPGRENKPASVIWSKFRVINTLFDEVEYYAFNRT